MLPLDEIIFFLFQFNNEKLRVIFLSHRFKKYHKRFCYNLRRAIH